MEKKLYFKLSDGADASNITMTLSGAMAWIEGADNTDEDIEYTLVPVWLTDEEHDKLPEADI